MKCTVRGDRYMVIGYGGKQVRDNIHAADVAAAFDAFRAAPRAGAVYNLGGGRTNSISVLEAIEACQTVAGRELDWSLDGPRRASAITAGGSPISSPSGGTTRSGSSLRPPNTLREIHDFNVENWIAEAPA